MKHDTGFTLIELIMVIVILGILSAVALPQFVDLSDEAEQASVDGIAGSLGAAATINFAAKKAGDAAATAVADCQDFGSLLQGGLDTVVFSITSVDISGLTEGQTNPCTVATTGTPSYSASFTGIKVD